MWSGKRFSLNGIRSCSFIKIDFCISVVILCLIIVIFSGCEDLGPEMEHDNLYDQENPEGYIARYPGYDSTFVLIGSSTIEMVWIPAGTFMMGAQAGESGANADEYPRHEVTISQGFWMGKYKVTQAQWEAVAGWEDFQWPGNPDHPAERVSHNDIMNDFLPELGNEWRLPTEAEWEYACRAGVDDQWFWWGSSYTNLSDYAWYSSNSGNQTHDVGTRTPNPWGLYDMHGNVWEWCSDWYDSDYYNTSPSTDPEGPGTGSNRVLRGGSWDYNAWYCRAAYRFYYSPSARISDIGFRLVRSE